MTARIQFIILRLILIGIISILALFLTFRMIYAGGGLVSQIGRATFVQGASQFWVTSSLPTFSGVTTAGATINGTVGSQSVSAVADDSGNWSWTPSADLTGDNTVSITDGSKTAVFTLTIGQLPESIASASGSTLAPAGTISPTIIFLGGGFILVLIGGWGLFRKSA
ncbi:hypothetical protein A3F02_01005 [Candidatus Curtissbacteria bacterium RIFCSPHIGHO2_12_FULL_38_9b]|uniref:Bacterial Ig-like domain-containing protein n=1 Tax=Candidatus Curtissbacteria bacterium RIFCSPHIGHO2_12_FULL_38_9b TaxID=1797720 RepID=A0A1F5GVL9_9BACT|nr:MAG: hypothetical protein A3F02_01005 [Candidatus Curtissbacteria bacterium RIFCSPHIGHO2_12_FULL_38_9b]